MNDPKPRRIEIPQRSSLVPSLWCAILSVGSTTARQGGVYAGKILNGAKPADLPVMQSVKFEYVINLKIAKDLSLEIAPTMLALADRLKRGRERPRDSRAAEQRDELAPFHENPARKG